MFLMAGGGMLALALIYGRGTLRPGLARASAPAPLPALPEPSPGGAALRFSLGINEAVSVPQKLLREGHFTPTTLAEHLDLDATRTASLGARFVRGHTGAFPRTSWWASTREPGAQDDADLWVRTVQAHGLEPILMVSPWPANQTANYTDTYVPSDIPAYTAWVTALVERYDGDGVDDMPGLLSAVRYWEVDNEPDLKFTTPPRDATRDVPPGSFCTPEEAATVLVATARAIRAASPSARILNGGLYRPFAESGQAWLRGLLAVPGAREAFDVLSLHTYAADEHGDVYVRGLAAARALVPDKPVFVTETSVASGGDDRWTTPEWQARSVAARAAQGAAYGASVVMWHTLADPPPGKRVGGLALSSLLTTSGDGSVTEKPAAAVFRALAARLAEDDLVGAEPDGDGAVRLRSGARLLYEGVREAPDGGVDLRTGAPLPAGAPATAPAWLWPPGPPARP